jgi:hypothetical protein
MAMGSIHHHVIIIEKINSQSILNYMGDKSTTNTNKVIKKKPNECMQKGCSSLAYIFFEIIIILKLFTIL